MSPSLAHFVHLSDWMAALKSLAKNAVVLVILGLAFMYMDVRLQILQEQKSADSQMSPSLAHFVLYSTLVP